MTPAYAFPRLVPMVESSLPVIVPPYGPPRLRFNARASMAPASMFSGGFDNPADASDR